MKIIYGGQLNHDFSEKAKKIAEDCGILSDTARLLVCRGIDTSEKARKFFTPGKKNFNDPFAFCGMTDAVRRIERARTEKERVVIFGDYDADGVCATSILFYALKEYGIDAVPVIPEREDGYGLNLGIIEGMNAENPIDLIITVDCGISDEEKIEKIKAHGTDVIVTDHHEPPEILPRCTVINPKVKGEKYPFDGLCGAGVAYKLARALTGERADMLLDFAALATVADSMELIGENRDIVYEGLKLFNRSDIRPCFKYIPGDSQKQVTAQTLAFSVAPRVNAGGRMGDARCALGLFICDKEDECFDRSVKLSQYNIARQVECENIYRTAKEKIKKDGCYKERIIMVYDEDWKTGFVGIVAARLAEEFSRPVIVFAGLDGMLKGSARSAENINIFEVICSAKDMLAGFGGHAQAAGVTVEKAKFTDLKNALNTYIEERYPEPETEKSIYAEWLTNDEFSLDFAREIEKMEPFGIGNRRPLFATEISAVRPVPVKFGSAHYSFNCNVAEIMDFNGENDVEILSMPVKKQIVFEPNLSVFKGREYFKGYLKGISPCFTYGGYELYAFMREIRNLQSVCEPYEKDRLSEIPSEFFKRDFRKAFGTIYAASDYKIIGNYPMLKTLPVSFRMPERENYADCVVISPASVPDGYDRIVYLDKPLGIFRGVTNCIIQDAAENAAAGKLSTDRSDIAEIYNILRNFTGKEFTSSAAFYEKYKPCDNGFQFVFVTEVMLELGIFFVKDGMLRQDLHVKSALTNSVIYSKINVVKG